MKNTAYKFGDVVYYKKVSSEKRSEFPLIVLEDREETILVITKLDITKSYVLDKHLVQNKKPYQELLIGLDQLEKAMDNNIFEDMTYTEVKNSKENIKKELGFKEI